MRVYIFFWLIINLAISTSGLAQAPVADFNTPASVCREQRVSIDNLSVDATSYEWDFCLYDMNNFKASADLVSIANLNFGVSLKIVSDNNNWYGFVLSENNNRLFRLNFGNNLSNSPIVTDLGNPGNLLIFPEGLDFVKVNGNWYAYIGHFNIGGGIVRLDFGSSLTNQPTAVNIGDFGFSVRFREIKTVMQNGNVVVILSNFNNNTLVRVNFGNDPTNTNPGVHETSVLTNLNRPLGLDVVKKGNNWIGLLSSTNSNEIFQLNFGSDILSDPTIEGQFSQSVSNPRNLQVVEEGDKFFAVVTNDAGAVGVLDFGILNPLVPPIAITTPALPAIVGIDVIRIQGKDFLFGVPPSGGMAKRITFESECGASETFSTTFSPTIHFSQSGVKQIELVAINNNLRSSSVRSINVSALESPVSSILTNGFVCANSTVQFSSAVTSGIQSFSWDFGDTFTDTGSTVNHSFSSGTYTVKLSLQGINGCENDATREIQIFNAPQANFALPTLPANCTSQTYTFDNTSIFDGASNPSWQWQIDGANRVTTEDSQFAFTQVRAFDIKLITSIPGCSSEIEKTFTIQAVGPLVDFSNPIPCENTAVPFTNLTAGAVTSVQWNFGDGNTSTSVNTSHAYPAKGDYPVTLTTTNAAGCQNFVTRTITVRSQPHPDFTLDLPPFSCTNTPSQFHDATPAMSDSNISSWAWAFGDAANGTSLLQDPSYTYTTAANYQVSLTTTTNFGCSNVLQKTVTIHQSPQANFSLAPACANQGTQFTDSSTGTIRSWMWSIQNTTYTTRNPIHVFVSPGNYTALLTVTGTNNCVSQLSKNISVPVVTTLDFSVQNPCATRPATFRETTQGGADPAVSWTWDFAGQPGSGSPTQHTFASTGNYSVRMNSTRQSGCVYSLTKTISMGVAPHAQFSVSSEIGPPPFSVAFTNTSTNANSYLWKFGDALNTTSTSVSPTFIYNQMGTYLAELTASNAQGCSDDFSRIIQALVPNVNGTLTDFKLTNNNNHWQAEVTIENKGNVPIINPDVYISISGHTTISEKVNGVVLPGQSLTEVLSVSLVPVNIQYACAELRLTGDLSDGDDRQCISISETTFALSPYPNPANDKISLEWINYGDESMRVVIYNVAGGVVFDKEYTNLLDGLNRIDVAVNDLLSGIYFISYRSASVNKSDRFSIIR